MNWSDYFTYDGVDLIRKKDETKSKSWNKTWANKPAMSRHMSCYVKVTCNYKYLLAH